MKASVIISLYTMAFIMLSFSDAAGRTSGMDKEKAQNTIVLIGASYAGGWNPGRPIAGYRFINKGVSGQQSFEMLARFEADVVALKPGAVIIWGFINDIFRSDREQVEQALARTRDSLTVMVESAKQSGVTPILATEVTIGRQTGWFEYVKTLIGKMLGKTSYQDFVNRHVIEMNRWIRDKAAKDGIPLLDLQTVLSDSKGERIKQFSQPDGSHIAEPGYEALTQFAEEYLKRMSPISGITLSAPPS